MIREELMQEPMPALQFDHVQDAIGLSGLRVPWMRLWARASENPFLSWAWMSASWSKVTPARRPLVIAARTAAGELMGVLPLSIERSGISRVARFLADETVGSDYLDALVAPELASPVRRALWTEALRLAGQTYDVLELRELVSDSETASMVEQLAPAHQLQLETTPGFRCPHIAISGTFAEHLKTVSRADNLKRRKKQLEREPGFAIEIARTPPELAPALEEFFRLHRLRWASDGGSQGITGPRIEAFHREVAPRLARDGLIRIYTLKTNDRPVASVYMLGAGATRYFYQSGYDPELAKQSPGLVLLARTIEDAFDEGAREYDFLHGSEPYKFEWANGERTTVSMQLTVPNFRGRWLQTERKTIAAVRAAGQKLLGERGYGALRRLRRRWVMA